MAKKFTVFLSSTGADLAEYRKAVMARLEKSDHIDCDGMENFGARPGLPDAFCRERAQACDVYVGLIGFYRGNDVPGDNAQRSFTEMEYAVATAAGKPRLMYIVPDGFAPPAPTQTKKAAKQQAAFRKSVLKNHVVSKEFHSPDRLAGAIAVDLMNLLAEKIAAAISQSRDGGQLPGQQQAVTEAVAAVMEGADEGDDRMARALKLLEENKLAQAEPLLREVAEEKAAKVEIDRKKIDKDSKDAAAAFRHLGAIAGLGDPKCALDAYLKAAALDPQDLDARLWVGHIQLERGYLAEAESRFQSLLSSTNDENQSRHRFWARLGLGDILSARGDLSAARAHYREAGSIADRLAKADPGNAGWQRDLSVSYEKIGNVQVAQGLLPDALQSFRDSHAIADRLAKADPGNAGWQRDLSVSYDRIGDVQVAQGLLPDALRSFRDSHAIFDRLAKADPGNAGWQRDVATSHCKLGDLAAEQNYTDKAIVNYQAALSIMERLAMADSSNAVWHGDIVELNHKLATLGDNSKDRLPFVVEALRALQSENRLTVEQATWLPIAEAKLAKMQGK